uniref:Translocase of outer mitochondrial membrane 40 like n=1 Tax=Cyanoderma ruficeps TaxID=181631 RepID=A0A8C3QK45_9PASS
MGNAGGRAPRRAQPRGNPGSFDELHRLCKGDTHGAHEHPGPLRLSLQRHLRGGPPAGAHRGVPHAARGHGQRGQPQRPGPAPAGRAPPRQGRLPGEPRGGGWDSPPCPLVSPAVPSAVPCPSPRQTHQAKFVTWQFDGEYRGDDCTATLTLGNPDLLGGSVIVVAHFLQSVTARLVLGGELVYHRRPGEEGAILTLAGKYSAPNWVSTLNVGYGGAHASYYHRANEQVGASPAPVSPPRCPRALPVTAVSPPAGAGGRGAGGQHAAAGDHLRLRLPAQPAAGQRGLQRWAGLGDTLCRPLSPPGGAQLSPLSPLRAPGQQLERGGGPGEEVAPPARHAGPGGFPQPLEEPVPLRLQRHRGLRGQRGQGGQRGQPATVLLREPAGATGTRGDSGDTGLGTASDSAAGGGRGGAGCPRCHPLGVAVAAGSIGAGDPRCHPLGVAAATGAGRGGAGCPRCPHRRVGRASVSLRRHTRLNKRSFTLCPLGSGVGDVLGTFLGTF